MSVVSNWKWFGTPGHFIGSANCRFHMCTLVGGYLVSTVGEYYPYDAKDEPKTIGCNRLYETMVFKAGAICKRPKCNCGLPEIDGSELDFEGYNDRRAATEGHAKLCAKWATKRVRKTA